MTSLTFVLVYHCVELGFLPDVRGIAATWQQLASIAICFRLKSPRTVRSLAAVLFLIIIACIVFFVLFFRLRATYTIPPRWRVNGSSCGNCAYSHDGQAVCPECGYAIKHVGIVTPRLLMMFGPSSRVAIGCLLVMAMISCGLMRQVGFLIETELLPANWRSGVASRGPQTGMLQDVSFVQGSSNEKKPANGSGWNRGTAPFGLTVVEQVTRGSGSLPQPATYGEVVMVLRPEKERPYSELSPEPLASFFPPLPHLRIDIVARTVQVIDAKGVRIAQYSSIDRRAFDELMQAGGIDRSDEATEEAVLAAKTVYQTIADSPDNGGPFPSWSERDFLISFQKPMRIMRSGGTIQNLPPLPVPPVTAVSVFIRLWPVLLVAAHIAAVVNVFRWILRRRLAIMEGGAAYAARPAAS